MPPSAVVLSYDEFVGMARQMFEVDDDFLEELYPMVTDLRALAQRISQIVIFEDDHPLSETATGE